MEDHVCDGPKRTAVEKKKLQCKPILDHPKESTKDWVINTFYSNNETAYHPQNTTTLHPTPKDSTKTSSNPPILKTQFRNPSNRHQTTRKNQNKLQWRPKAENGKASHNETVSHLQITSTLNPNRPILKALEKENQKNAEPHIPRDFSSSAKPPTLSYAEILKKNQGGTTVDDQTNASNASSKVEVHSSEPAIYFEESVISAGAEKFKYCLVGKFPRSCPSLACTRDWARQVWKLRGDCTVTLLDAHHVFIRLDNISDMIRIWVRNRWWIDGHLMKVFKWTPKFQPTEAEPSSAAVWISLPSLPIVFFQEDLLFAIASLVGKALSIDNPTRNLTQTNVARICVEVNLLMKLPRRVWIGVGKGGFWQDIRYRKLPSYCSNCRHQGHSTRICKFNTINAVTSDSQNNTANSTPGNSNHGTKRDEHSQEHSRISKVFSQNSVGGKGSEGSPGKPDQTCPTIEDKDANNQPMTSASSQLPLKRVTIVEAVSKSIANAEKIKSRKNKGETVFGGTFTSLLILNETFLQTMPDDERVRKTLGKKNSHSSSSNNKGLCSPITTQVCPGSRHPPFAPTPNISSRGGNGAKNNGAIAGKVISGATRLAWWRRRKPQGHLFDVPADVDAEVQLGHIKRFSLRELQVATRKFSNETIIGRGGFGKVYKGRLADGSLVAIKRLKEERTPGVERQFQSELEMVRIGVHQNLIRLLGFCVTLTERILVFPYMVNGSVASCLRERPRSQPPLDWTTRTKIALGSARGLSYLHDHCERMIIHRDVKAANILLDEQFEPFVCDFGLAKLIDYADIGVTTTIRGTIGHIAPEYLSTGKCSEKTDVFGYGIFLLELITGQRAFDLARLANDGDVMLLDWVKEFCKMRKLDMLVDPDLHNNYWDAKVEQLIQIALLCTQASPKDRPRMFEVMKFLEGSLAMDKSWWSLCNPDHTSLQSGLPNKTVSHGLAIPGAVNSRSFCSSSSASQELLQGPFGNFEVGEGS
ncbi:uncharacterized protein LOC143885154 [Tasmannia lanceolata]|uniref:uncharacterized protein LOC143885154 n=1 Tax=Tasmannia lanceolata TaxID=3420 RepID=UPI004064C3E5